jgi:hypothetical protein
VAALSSLSSEAGLARAYSLMHAFAHVTSFVIRCLVSSVCRQWPSLDQCECRSHTRLPPLRTCAAADTQTIDTEECI